MEKRVFVAVLLSIAILVGFPAIMSKLFPQYYKKPVPAVTKTTTVTTGSQPAVAAPATTSAAAPVSPAPAQAGGLKPAPTVDIAAPSQFFTTIAANDFIAVFSNRGAELVSFKLKGYKAKDGTLVELVKARDASRTDFAFAIEAADPNVGRTLNTGLYVLDDKTVNNERVLTYSFASGGIAATKTFRLDDEYLFHFNVSVTPPVKYRVAIGPGIRTLDPDERDSQFIITGNGVVQIDNSLKLVRREKADPNNVYENAQYAGIEDNYFLAALKPEKASTAILRRIDVPVVSNAQKKDEKRPELYAAINADNGVVAGSAFFGPKQTTILDRYGLEKTLQFGMFGVIARFLLLALLWVNKFTHNYGWAIIALTVVIKIVLYPLQHKSIVSMKKMQKVQPKAEAIKAKYKKAKTDPEQRNKMNMEVMKLYQQEGINPMGGCLPMVLQLPILWGFYGLLSRAIELRGAPWILWIHDLSAKDPTYILPILMTATMFVQQFLTPTTVDPAQRRMFLFMPLIFGWIFKEFPSGLVLYWLVQNILSIVQQLIMNKYWKDHPDEIKTA